MKKIILLIGMICMISISSFAQNGSTQRPFKSGFHLFISGGLHAFDTPRAIRIPKTLGLEFVIMDDISAGLVFTHYTFKNQEPYEIPDTAYATHWIDDSSLYTHLFYGIKGAYHLNSILDKAGIHLNPRRWDLYVGGMIGLNSISINSPNDSASVDDILNAEIDTESKLRGGLALGLRYFYSNSISIYLEGTINHYGYASFGVCYKPF